MDNTKIEWTDATWNPLRGCSRVSAGCVNCYAEGMAARFSNPGLWGNGIATRTDHGGRWTGKVVLDEKALLKPLRWRRPRKVFVTSLSDPFHPDVTDDMLDRVFTVIDQCPQHTFQLLTKRPERMLSYVRSRTLLPKFVNGFYGLDEKHDLHQTIGNLWLGVSVEDQATADERIPHLIRTPAKVAFLSCEPLLGPVSIPQEFLDLGQCGWVIAGGESGPKARPMHPDWVRSLRYQCAAAGVPFFFKQWGEWMPHNAVSYPVKKMPVSRWLLADGCLIPPGQKVQEGDNAELMCRVGKKTAGRLLDGLEHNGFPVIDNDER